MNFTIAPPTTAAGVAIRSPTGSEELVDASCPVEQLGSPQYCNEAFLDYETNNMTDKRSMNAIKCACSGGDAETVQTPNAAGDVGNREDFGSSIFSDLPDAESCEDLPPLSLFNVSVIQEHFPEFVLPEWQSNMLDFALPGLQPTTPDFPLSDLQTALPELPLPDTQNTMSYLQIPESQITMPNISLMEGEALMPDISLMEWQSTINNCTVADPQATKSDRIHDQFEDRADHQICSNKEAQAGNHANDQIGNEANDQSEGGMNDRVNGINGQAENGTDNPPEDRIRCVCGENEEYAGWDMAACDECGVWQHLGCMELPEAQCDADYWQDKEYYCEQCRPENHRKLLRRGYQLRCICGHNQEYPGWDIAACDECGFFQHLECMDLPKAQCKAKYWENKQYYCEKCRPENHRELLKRGYQPYDHATGLPLKPN